VRLWDANCLRVVTGTQISVGQGRICITNATPGVKYVLSVKYDSKSVIGSGFTGTAPTCTYTFESRINGKTVAESRTSINMVPNCSVPTTTRTSEVVQAPAVNQSEDTELKVSLTPNPTPENFRLFVTSASKKIVIVRVFDVNGKMVKQIKTSTYELISFGNDLKQGLYFIEVIQGKDKKVVRAMKM
jgi:Secretion system C-terminal sorting domain